MRERRQLVNVRLSIPGLYAVDRFAMDRGISRSAAIRLMLGYACRHQADIPEEKK